MGTCSGCQCTASTDCCAGMTTPGVRMRSRMAASSVVSTRTAKSRSSASVTSAVNPAARPSRSKSAVMHGSLSRVAGRSVSACRFNDTARGRRFCAVQGAPEPGHRPTRRARRTPGAGPARPPEISRCLGPAPGLRSVPSFTGCGSAAMPSARAWKDSSVSRFGNVPASTARDRAAKSVCRAFLSWRYFSRALAWASPGRGAAHFSGALAAVWFPAGTGFWPCACAWPACPAVIRTANPPSFAPRPPVQPLRAPQATEGLQSGEVAVSAPLPRALPGVGQVAQNARQAARVHGLFVHPRAHGASASSRPGPRRHATRFGPARQQRPCRRRCAPPRPGPGPAGRPGGLAGAPHGRR